MANETTAAFWIRIGLTVCAMEFFGPILRDFGASHAMNPTWVGHARVHLVWLLGFMLFSGIANLYLIWFRPSPDPLGLGNLRLSAAWQSCNLGGFWLAYFLAPMYDGAITVPGIHTHILGFDENVFAFAILSAIMVALVAALFRLGRSMGASAAGVGERA